MSIYHYNVVLYQKGHIFEFVMCYQVISDLKLLYELMTSKNILLLTSLLRSYRLKAVASFIECIHLMLEDGYLFLPLSNFLALLSLPIQYVQSMTASF